MVDGALAASFAHSLIAIALYATEDGRAPAREALLLLKMLVLNAIPWE